MQEASRQRLAAFGVYRYIYIHEKDKFTPIAPDNGPIAAYGYRYPGATISTSRSRNHGYHG